MTFWNSRPPTIVKWTGVIVASFLSIGKMWAHVRPGVMFAWGSAGGLGAITGAIAVVLGFVALLVGIAVFWFFFTRRWSTMGAIVVAVAIFGFMDQANRATNWGEPAGLVHEDGQMAPLVVDLFEEHVLALEVLGILLTAAMIGAMVIARPLGQAEDDTNYRSDPGPMPRAEIPGAGDMWSGGAGRPPGGQ